MKFLIKTKIDCVTAISQGKYDALDHAIKLNSFDIDLTIKGRSSPNTYSFRVSPMMHRDGGCLCKNIGGNNYHFSSDISAIVELSVPSSFKKDLESKGLQLFFTGFGVGGYGFVTEEPLNAFPAGEIATIQP
jgi:hypothetical protein